MNQNWEFVNLFMRNKQPDEKIWDILAKSPQSIIFHFQRQIKEAFDPNDIGDRNYPTLPRNYR